MISEVEGKFYPSVSMDAIHKHGGYHAPSGAVYVCPKCGNSWARFHVMHTVTKEVSRYMPWAMLCSSCKGETSYANYAGTVMRSWDVEFSSSLSPELLRRELEILLQQYP